ncbi:CehA/McbA family metallohydrolase domain-containing protein [Candidatus Laterigemmans baculatus]|uniref:hypothetical protein n=1 Tax=Candidatus Laterigemmans baculatus TaxID=2770505 RepID=UPI0013DD202D|nr:hypothetical protein [Candidatus Laterigemmans baculatus]
MRSMLSVILVLTLAVSGALSVSASRGEDAVPADPPLRWWKGNLHTHTLWSDGDHFPEMAGEWYRTHGYNFLALSDHNVLSQGMRWMKVGQIESRGGGEALPKYRARFGDHWVETRGEGEDLEVRLKPLDEFRYVLEERGRFIMIPSEEISDRAEGKPVHMNVTNVAEVIEPLGGETVREAIANNFRSVEEQAARLGREMLLHLNHPNFGWAITPEDLAHVTGEKFFEVYNGHPGVNHLGDAERPSVERFWDLANVLRLAVLNAEPLMGIATDDTHDYHGNGGSRMGRGWVMVHARFLTPEHLIRAIKRGDFYASSGVTLQSVEYDAESKTLTVEIDPVDGETYRTEFIASLAPEAGQEVAPEKIGATLASSDALRSSYTLTGNELYVRAVVTSSAAADDPSFEGQKKQAWTQPVGWKLKKSAE